MLFQMIFVMYCKLDACLILAMLFQPGYLLLLCQEIEEYIHFTLNNIYLILIYTLKIKFNIFTNIVSKPSKFKKFYLKNINNNIVMKLTL